MLWTHKENCLRDEVSSSRGGLAVVRERNGGGVGSTVGKSMHAQTTDRR